MLRIKFITFSSLTTYWRVREMPDMEWCLKDNRFLGFQVIDFLANHGYIASLKQFIKDDFRYEIEEENE